MWKIRSPRCASEGTASNFFTTTRVENQSICELSKSSAPHYSLGCAGICSRSWSRPATPRGCRQERRGGEPHFSELTQIQVGSRWDEEKRGEGAAHDVIGQHGETLKKEIVLKERKGGRGGDERQVKVFGSDLLVKSQLLAGERLREFSDCTVRGTEDKEGPGPAETERATG